MDFVSANLASVLGTTQQYLVWALDLLAVVGAVVALVHAAVQRPDAFTAVDRQTKPIWIAILTASTVFLVVFGVTGGTVPVIGIICLVAVVAVIVYLVDVRPKVDEIQGRHWFRKR
ncbi:DUF2516 family protein [Gordonia sp. X0973]|uniref:DUF2516 family protein n=1 Tax=Gordonia sp. X0973 TaxID=2742602 RepID=UPI000F539FB4|nr:DUF2516 family protein [Gordonia sp. X0973]QKT06188.1 DUF2516 family protein [Gordonia sp. X0973]